MTHEIAVKRMPHAADLPLPSYATDRAAGMDLYAAEDCFIPEMCWKIVKTGLIIALPRGTELQIRPRSGAAARHGVTVLNSPGTIDEDYRGEIGVILMNHGRDIIIQRGDRIAQAVLAPVLRATWREVDELPGTARGDGGFGSTGTT